MTLEELKIQIDKFYDKNEFWRRKDIYVTEEFKYNLLKSFELAENSNSLLLVSETDDLEILKLKQMTEEKAENIVINMLKSTENECRILSPEQIIAREIIGLDKFKELSKRIHNV